MEVIGLVRAVWARARLTCNRERSTAREIIGAFSDVFFYLVYWGLYILVMVHVFVLGDPLAQLLIRLSCRCSGLVVYVDSWRASVQIFVFDNNRECLVGKETPTGSGPGQWS